MTLPALLIAVAGLATSFGICAEPLGLSGAYIGDGFSLTFEGERCFATGSRGDISETKCLRKGNLLYIAPIVPKGERMIRDVWVAYTILDDRLESSHLEDMDDGHIFYKDRKPKLILHRQVP